MNIDKINSIYFSPNGSSKKIINMISVAIGSCLVEEINLNSIESRGKKREFKEDELVVIGFPVYADRLPSISDEIFNNIKGNNTPAVAIVSYGNRDYGDALLELKNKLEEKGFKIVSAAAIIGEHCLNTNVAKGRPDKEDEDKIREFANKTVEKIRNLESIHSFKDVKIKGDFPYHPLKSQHSPSGDSKCIQCGICQENCPVDAISKEDYRKTDSEICIFCGKCIQVCPTNARDMKDESFLKFLVKLENMTSERKEIEEFF